MHQALPSDPVLAAAELERASRHLVAAPLAGGRSGNIRAPGWVVLATLLTLGLAGFWWWHRWAREVDAWTGRRGEVSRSVSGGQLLVAAGLALLLPALAYTLATRPRGSSLGEPAGAIALGALGVLLLVIGFSVWLQGAYTAWEHLARDERRRRHPTAMLPELQLALHLIPIINLAGLLASMHRTQRALNGAWTGTHT